MANPVRNSSSKRHVGRDSDSDEEGSPASRANSHGSNIPAPSGKPPAVSATSTTSGGGSRTGTNAQPPVSGKAGATGSQPTYASGDLPSARELALRASANQTRAAMQAKDPLKALKKIFKNADAVRLVLPTRLEMEEKSDPYSRICERKWLMRIPIRHLDLRLESCTPGDTFWRSNQMSFVTQLLDNCDDLHNSGSPGITIDLDVPMSTQTNVFSMGLMYSKNLYDALANSKALVRVRVNGYIHGIDKLTCLIFGDKLLGDNPKIREFELFECMFGDEDAYELAGALEQNNSIKSLVFNNCRIPVEGAKALAEAFRKRPDMQVAGFRQMPIGSLAQPGSQNSKSSGKANKTSATTVNIPNTANTANSGTTK